MQIERGTVFGHRYVVQSQIGTGGMATVYRGIDQTLDRLVAIKVMLERYAQDPSFAARFKQEAQAAAALQSPYIVSVYDWGQEGDTYYIIMEYLRGTDLKSGIRSHGALAPRKVAQIGAQVCQALSVAHAHEIIHRDIKPQNIMIQPNGDAKVMDFGIARSKNSHLTTTNSVLGTAHYVSPEQAQGKPLGPTSDLYSLGVVMYEASTGKLPFDGDDAVSVALKQVNEEPVPPSEVNPNVDDDLNAIIMKCMAKNPAERFQTADELRRTLNNYIMGRPIGLGGTTTVLAGGTRTTVMPQGTEGRTQRMSGATRPMGAVGGAQGATPMQHAVHPTPVGAEQQDEREHRGISGGAIAAIVIVVAIILIVAIVLLVSSCSGGSGTGGSATDRGQAAASASAAAEQVTVPDVTNKTVSEASNELKAVGLSVGTQSNQASDTVAKGNIISTTPAANEKVDKGSKVAVVVSTGAETVTLPSVSELKGLTETEAVQKLTAAGVTAVHDESLDAYDADVAEGLFLTLDPSVANQTKIAKGSTVKYGLSKGVDPATLPTTVPSVAGTYFSDAESAIVSAELNYSEYWVYDSSTAQGVVISSDPGAGSSLTKWSTVTITISNGPQPVSVSSYVGSDVDEAASVLQAAGLSVIKNEVASDAAPGTVISQNPSSGTLSAGQSVTLTYSDGSLRQQQPTQPAQQQQQQQPQQQQQTDTSQGAGATDNPPQTPAATQ